MLNKWAFGIIYFNVLQIENFYMQVISMGDRALTIYFKPDAIFHLTVNSICSFRQLTGIWGWGVVTPPKISKITGRMTMKFLPDVKLRRHEIRKKMDIT